MIEKIKYKGRDNWLELRRSGVGGSEAGIIMGISPYGSELTLWYDKIGAAEPKEANLAMKMGNHLEQLVADEFCERNGKRVREQHFMMRNSKYPFAIGNIDRRVVGENAILECKTTGSRPKMKQFRNGEYPDTWYCQCQHYMAVGNYKMAYLAVIYRNDAGDYEQWEIPRDDEFIEVMMAAEEAFWDKVVNRVRPDPKGHPDENGIINAMSPAKSDMKAQIGMLRDALNKYEEYGELEKRYHQIREEQKNIICAAMGSATDGYIGDEKVCTWREQHKKSYVVSESTSRVFRIYHDTKKGKKKMDKKSLAGMIIDELIGVIDNDDNHRSVKLLSSLEAMIVKSYMKDHEVKITIKNFDGLSGINVQIESDLQKDFPAITETVGYVAQQGYISIMLDMLKSLDKKHLGGKKLDRESIESWCDANLGNIKNQIIERYLDGYSEEEEDEND